MAASRRDRTVCPGRSSRALLRYFQRIERHLAAMNGVTGSNGLAVSEEFVVLIVAAVAAADVVEVGDELNAVDPFDLFEAEFDLITQA